MAEEGQNTFVGSVISGQKLYYSCGTDIFHIPTRNLLHSPFSRVEFSLSRPLYSSSYVLLYFFFYYCYYPQMPHQAPEKANRLSVKEKCIKQMDLLSIVSTINSRLEGFAPFICILCYDLKYTFMHVIGTMSSSQQVKQHFPRRPSSGPT